jgi:phosphoribosylformimino-5-aminoimidazole carboxamide ribonucleotide (ProFAR) isomerase
VRRIVVSHWGISDLPVLADIVRRHDLEVQLAGGALDLATVDAAAAAGIDALILGEALFSGAVDYQSTVAHLAAAKEGITAHG